MRDMACHAVHKADPPCDGWTHGWKWHGCALDPGHGLPKFGPVPKGMARVPHECKCGFKWGKGVT
jgi:hypothetical protein